MIVIKKFRYILKAAICLCVAASILLAGCAKKDGDDKSSTKTEENVPAGAEPQQSGKKRVAMTFDDGPHNVRTKEIVDELDKYGFTATFFMVGSRIDGTEYNGAKTVKCVIEHGHEVGIHGYSHKVYYDRCTDEEYKNEIEKTAKAIKAQVSDYNIKLMRPVGGYITDKRVQTSPYSVIMWNVDSFDYEHAYFPDTSLSEAEQKQYVSAIVDNVMSNVKDGSIILMHDIYLSTSHATAIILERLNAEGYEVVSVSELLGDPQPGVKYNSKQ